MIINNIQLQKNSFSAVQWTGKNSGEIVEILSNAHSFSKYLNTWNIKSNYDSEPIKLEWTDILVWFEYKSKYFFQVYSLDVFKLLFVNPHAFKEKYENL